MIVTVRGPASLSEYLNLSEPPQVERPAQCPKGCCRPMWNHTGYERTAEDKNGSRGVVKIPRFRCGLCGLIVSCLFDFLVPYVIYTVAAIAAWVAAYTEELTTYDRVAWDVGAPETPRPTIFRRIAGCVNRAKEVADELQSECMLAGAEKAESHTLAVVCPNSWKAWSAKKRANLDRVAALLVRARFVMRQPPVTGAEILGVLHGYFMTTAEELTTIFFRRKDMTLSNQQSMRCPIF